MINHMRTLLLNRHSSWFDDVAYAEYVPASFQPVVLDTFLQKVKDILVPKGLDPTAENYLAAVLLKTLHMPDLLTYTTQPDARYTYSTTLDYLARLIDIPLIVDISKTSTCDITLEYKIDAAGHPVELRQAGKHVWMLRKESDRELKVQYSRGSTVITDIINPTTPTTSKDVVLLPGYITVYFTLPSNILTGGFTYRLETAVGVPYDIATRSAELDRALAQAGLSDRIFRPVGRYADTISELHDAWLNTTEITLKFGTVMLSYLYQLDALYSR